MRQPLLRAIHPRGCLFCLRHDGGFVSREHIVSEALGNQAGIEGGERILRPGVVCDRCNHGPLSRADTELVNFPPVAMLRAERGLGGKNGQPAIAKFGNATISFTGVGQMNVYTNSKKTTRDMPADGIFKPNTTGKLRLSTGGPMTAQRLRHVTRAVWKAGFEYLYLDKGAAYVMDPLFDDARAAVIDTNGTDGWAVLQRDSQAQASVDLTHRELTIDGRRALVVVMNIFGVHIATDLLRRDLTEDQINAPAGDNVWIFNKANRRQAPS